MFRFIIILLALSAVISCSKSNEPEDPDPLELNLAATHVSHYGASDGAIDLDVHGGSEPYAYLWSNGETTEDISNLSAGTYSVTVTDTDTQTETDSTTITEPESEAYFNIPFPSTTVTRFAIDMFTEEFHAPPIFSPDGDEVYWSLMDLEPGEILCMKLVDGIWSDAAVASFSHSEGSDSAFISSDGSKLTFLSRHNAASGENIWIVEKSNGEWGTPSMLGNEVNQFDPHWQASIAANQNLYFGGFGGDAGDIYFSEYVDGSYTTAQSLGSVIINDFDLLTTPFIAPDESYLIFARVGDGYPYSDLFITFKQNDGNWGEAVNMSGLNTGYHELYANVSPNGRFIMFLSGRSGLLFPYWVDASIIDEYRTN